MTPAMWMVLQRIAMEAGGRGQHPLTSLNEQDGVELALLVFAQLQRTMELYGPYHHERCSCDSSRQQGSALLDAAARGPSCVTSGFVQQNKRINGWNCVTCVRLCHRFFQMQAWQVSQVSDTRV
jgi:hypothetical protein